MTDTTTLLVLSGGIPPYSARGARQSLQPIPLSINLKRTVNGELIDMSPHQMRKFKGEISCNDHQAPAFSGLWPGDTITVDTVVELAYLTANPLVERIVAGSYEDGDYTFFRLRLTVKVADWHIDKDEWGAVTGWKLDIEEV